MHKHLYFGKHTIRYSQITKNVILIILSFEAVYIYMAVVVQKIINSKISGVMFKNNVVNNKDTKC